MSDKKNKKEEKEEIFPRGIRKMNSITCGDFEIHSSTESFDKIVRTMKSLIKEYEEICNMRTLDKIKGGTSCYG